MSELPLPPASRRLGDSGLSISPIAWGMWRLAEDGRTVAEAARLVHAALDQDKTVRREVLTRLNAAKGGGLIFQSDHSATSSVAGRTYDTVIALVRQYGRSPIELGEFDELPASR